MKNKQITFGALISYVAIAFNILSGLIYTPWMIRTIGDDQYALYTLALSIINIFLLDFGIGSAVTKFLSNYYARDEYKLAEQFMGVVYKVFIAISFVITLALTVFYFFIDAVYAKLTVDEIVVFKRLFIIVAVYSVVSFPFTTFNGVLMANERFIELKTCNLAQKVLSVALIILFLLTGRGVYALVLVHAITNFFFLLVKYIIIRKKTKQKTDFKSWDKNVATNLFSYSAWYTVMNIAHRCIFNIMPTIIAAVVGSAEVTMFSLAATLEAYVYTFADAVNGMFMPKISRIINGKDVEKNLTSLMTKVGKFHIATIGFICIGFICIGKDFVYLWMGKGYEPVYWCTILLIIPSLLYIPQQVGRTALLAKDIIKEQSFVYVGMAVINIVLSFILLNAFGIVGAALSVCIAYIFRTFGMNFLYNKFLKVNLKKFYMDSYGRWSVAAIITTVVGLYVANAININGWVGLALKALVIAVIYGILFIVICVDFKMIKNVFNKLRHRGK